MLCCGSKKWRWLILRTSRNPRDQSKFWDAERKDCFCSGQDHPEFQVQEEGQSRGTESPKRGPVAARKTDRLHDLRLLSSDWCSWRSVGLRWFILCYSSWWQYSGIRYKIGWSSTIDVKNSIRWCLGTSVQIEDTWVCATQNRIGSGEEEYRSETSITKLWRQAWENWIGVEGGKGICHQWKEKASVRKETDAVSVTKPKIVHKKPGHTTATPSEPTVSRGRSVSRKRKNRGNSNHGSILRQPCRSCLRGTCTRTPCEYWHPPDCQFNKNETGCNAGDKCLFPHYKVDEQSFKKQKKERLPKKGEKAMITRMLWLLWKVYHKWVVYHKIQLYWFLKVESLGETRCRKSWNQFKESSEYLGKEGPSLGKINVNVPLLRSPYAMKFEDSSQEETERQQRCARSKDWNVGKKHKQPQRERQGYILLFRGGMGTPGCVNKRAVGKRVCCWFRSECLHVVSEKGRPLGHQEVRRRWWQLTARCKQEKKRQYMSNNWTFLQSYASWRNSCSSCFKATLWGSWAYILLDLRSKTTSHQKLQENWLPKIQLGTNCVPGSSASSSSSAPSPASSSSSSKDSPLDINRYTENPVQERSGSTSEELRGKPAAWIHRNQKQK